MGVWIETEVKNIEADTAKKSHPSWVCGLKQAYNISENEYEVSHPSWVCGLKPGVKGHKLLSTQSHPSWVCGLKLLALLLCLALITVTPFVGVWIETADLIDGVQTANVTPFVGVWIETLNQQQPQD